MTGGPDAVVVHDLPEIQAAGGAVPDLLEDGDVGRLKVVRPRVDGGHAPAVGRVEVRTGHLTPARAQPSASRAAPGVLASFDPLTPSVRQRLS